jgi:hypothetical protein
VLLKTPPSSISTLPESLHVALEAFSSVRPSVFVAEPLIASPPSVRVMPLPPSSRRSS